MVVRLDYVMHATASKFVRAFKLRPWTQVICVHSLYSHYSAHIHDYGVCTSIKRCSFHSHAHFLRSSMETDSKPATQSGSLSIEEALELAKKAFALKKYEQAVDHYATALELMCVNPQASLF